LGLNYIVTNSQGTQIKDGTETSYFMDEVITIDLSTVSNGIYVLRVETQYGFIQTKLLKQQQ
ncbi:T9SS type A sorting domain-containing protein, partial [uncultured Roseivirga sp.]|uniref:T9SS type A sorting domain-containing protein n=1 Tax=uncultured Roseivirga sp. TaxID=543088 RepID=UPI0030D76AD1